MDKLWAPWRVKYIDRIGKDEGCVFCRIIKQAKDEKNFVFARRKYTFAVLNIYPYNNGHSLVLPYRHVDGLEKLYKEERDELLDLAIEVKARVDQIIKPTGYNIGLNLGRSAGAGFPGHLHMHVVPRWEGDANFMSTVSDSRVISQSLQELYKKLNDAHTTRNRRTRR